MKSSLIPFDAAPQPDASGGMWILVLVAVVAVMAAVWLRRRRR